MCPNFLRNLTIKSKAWLRAATFAALSSADKACEGGLWPWLSSPLGVPKTNVKLINMAYLDVLGGQSIKLIQVLSTLEY